MRLQLIAFILCISCPAFTQTIGISGGINKNKLIPDGPLDFRKTELGMQEGKSMSFQLNIQPTTSKQSLSILLDHYKGEIYPQHTYSDVPDVICVEKTTLGLGLYPYDIRIIGDLYIQPGAGISILISDKTRLGNNENYSSTGSMKMTYTDDSLHIANYFQFGIDLIIRYQFNLGNYFIAPSYKIYLGGRSEFGKNAELVYKHMGDIYSFRQIVSIVIGRKLYWRKVESKDF